jgi:hypothetical protein
MKNKSSRNKKKVILASIKSKFEKKLHVASNDWFRILRKKYMIGFLFFIISRFDISLSVFVFTVKKSF